MLSATFPRRTSRYAAPCGRMSTADQTASHALIIAPATAQHMHAFHLRDSVEPRPGRGQRLVPGLSREPRVDTSAHRRQGGRHPVPSVSLDPAHTKAQLLTNHQPLGHRSAITIVIRTSYAIALIRAYPSGNQFESAPVTSREQRHRSTRSIPQRTVDPGLGATRGTALGAASRGSQSNRYPEPARAGQRTQSGRSSREP